MRLPPGQRLADNADSPGPVVFSHETHVELSGGSCLACHPSPFSISGMEGAAGLRYLPTWMDIVVSLGLVAIGMAVFALAVRYLPILHEEPALAERGGVAHRMGSVEV